MLDLKSRLHAQELMWRRRPRGWCASCTPTDRSTTTSRAPPATRLLASKVRFLILRHDTQHDTRVMSWVRSDLSLFFWLIRAEAARAGQARTGQRLAGLHAYAPLPRRTIPRAIFSRLHCNNDVCCVLCCVVLCVVYRVVVCFVSCCVFARQCNSSATT